MYISDEGLDLIEKAADKKKSAETLLLVQILKELRELSILMKQNNNSGYGCNNRTYSSDNSNDK